MMMIFYSTLGPLPSSFSDDGNLVLYDRGNCGRSLIYGPGYDWRFEGGDPSAVSRILTEPSCKSCPHLNPVVVSVTPNVMSYPAEPEGPIEPFVNQISSTTFIINKGNSPAATLTVSFTFTLTTTNTITSETSSAVKAGLKIGTPKFMAAEGKVTFGVEKSWNDTDVQTETFTQTFTITTTQSVPAFTNQTLIAFASIGTITCKVRIGGSQNYFLAMHDHCTQPYVF